jgi:protein-tyrosine phosphatase
MDPAADTEAPARDIALRDTFNLRDIGGYPTADGRRVRWRTVLRGAGLHRLRGEDGERVAALGLRTAIDLRTPAEHAGAGGVPAAIGAETVHLPLIAQTWPQPLPAAGDASLAFLLARYEEMLVEGGPSIAAALRILARPERVPAVFFCAAGKDRTGVLAAVLLALLGVDDDDVAADYHLSRDQVARIMARRRARRGLDPMIDQPDVMLDAPPGAITGLLAGIRERHGSIERYAAEIGVGAETVAGLRAALLEG